MRTKRKRAFRMIPALLLLLLFASVLPGKASAAGDSVRIGSERNDAFDYLEYSTGGSWKDLNTPKHWVEGSGEVCYCVEHTESSPHGASYRAAEPGEVFSGTTLKGLETILLNGYPCVTPDGFSADEARQATANAIRFWLSERGESGSYSFTNRKEHPDQVRAKSGYGHVLEWADQLLEMARNGRTERQEISFDPEALVLRETGEGYAGTAEVRIRGMEEYELDTSLLPDGVRITGYTGKGSETLTVEADAAAAGERFSVLAAGKGVRSADNITAYIPSNGSLQKIFLCAEAEQVVASAKLWVNIPSAPQTGSLTLSKVGENQEPLSGVRFGVYADAECREPVAELVTDSSGNASLEGLDPGTVYVRELQAPDGYTLDRNVYPVGIPEGAGTQLTVGNRKASGRIRVVKTGENGEPLAGVSFGIYSDPACTDLVREGRTDSSGILEVAGVADGDWYVRELETVRPYELSRETAQVSIVNGATFEVRMVNRIRKGSILVIKTGDDGEPLEGVSFGLYSDPGCTGPAREGKTNENGTLTFRDLEAGTYYLRELETVPPYETDDSIRTVSAEDGSTAEIRVVNRKPSGSLRIKKTGPDGEPVSGARFAVFRDEACAEQTASAVTGADGRAEVSGLPEGTVYVRETAVPVPYVLDGTVRPAEIRSGQTAELEIRNRKASGRIRIEKTAPQQDVPERTETEYGPMFVPKLAEKGLGGAVFEIRDAEGTACGTVTTGDSGTAELGGLPFGSYTVVETRTPDGYVLDPEPHAVTLSYRDDQSAETVETVRLANERIPNRVRIRKIAERFDASEKAFVPVPGEGFVFGLYTTEQVGTCPAGTLVELLVTGADGTAETEYPHAAGAYELRELKTPDPAVRLLEQPLPVSLRGTHALYAETPILNERHRGIITVQKADAETGLPLAGARFELRDENGLFLKELVTGENGTASSDPLPAGKYLIRELEPPKGYAGNGKTVWAEIQAKAGSNPVVRWTNQPIRSVLTKTDLTDGRPVPGAEITIRKSDGSVYFRGITDRNGEILLDRIPAGIYTFTETAAPEGYALNPETFRFTVDGNGKITGDTEITDEPTCLALLKVRAETGEPMKDVLFTLRNRKGKTVRTMRTEEGFRIPSEDGEENFRTDGNGRAEIRYLPAGDYTLAETAPAGMIPSDPVPVTLTERNGTGNPASVTVKNAGTALKLFKTDAETGKPLSGASFRILAEDKAEKTVLAFRQREDGSWAYDPSGAVKEVPVDGNGEILFAGIPIGTVWIEESAVPEGYFPAKAEKLKVTAKMTLQNPGQVTVKNSRFVKLGLDTDRWVRPVLKGLFILLGVSAAALVLFLAAGERYWKKTKEHLEGRTGTEPDRTDFGKKPAERR